MIQLHTLFSLRFDHLLHTMQLSSFLRHKEQEIDQAELLRILVKEDNISVPAVNSWWNLSIQVFMCSNKFLPFRETS